MAILCGCPLCAAGAGSSPAAATGDGTKPSFTATEAAVEITRGGSSWATEIGQGASITYSFMNALTSASYYSGTAELLGGSLPSAVTTSQGFLAFDAQQIAAAELALALWSDVANISVTRVSDPASAYSADGDIRFGGLFGGSSYAYTYLPSSAGSPNTEESGDVWFDLTETSLRNLSAGGYGFQTLVHEIGHALGLRHPGEYNGSASYAADAAYAQDTQQYSVMSYFAAEYSGAQHYTSNVLTPLLHDIAAAQALYGANLTTRTGDTVYGFNSNADRSVFRLSDATAKPVFAIWDAGGYDTFDLSGYTTGQKIDLREGAFSNVGGLQANVAIAFGTVIEAAIGTAADDTIIGGEAGNQLTGNDGADSLEGNGGNDLIFGGGGWDTLFGGIGEDTLFGGANGDSLDGGDGLDVLFGETGADTLTGGAGADTLFGGASSDQLDGGADDDFVDGQDGNDRIQAGAGADIVLAGNGTDYADGFDGNDRLFGWWGTDTLLGGEGDDLIDGEQDADFLYGWLGNDTIFGGDGNDIISGEAGDDRLWGFFGDDTINGGEGADWMAGEAGNDTLDGGLGDDLLFGWTGRDTLRGGDGDDLLAGEQEADVSFGGEGADIVFADEGADWADGEAGFDRVFGWTGNDTLFGGNGDDFVDGEQDDDQLSGGTGNDTVYGGAGNDVVSGDDGDDWIWGWTGNDTLTGGAGNDTIGGEAGDDLIIATGAFGNDTLVGLSAGEGAGDRVQVSGFTSLADVMAAMSVVNGAVVLTAGAGNSITFVGISDVSRFAEDDFLYI